MFRNESIDKIFDKIDFNIFNVDNFISKHKFQCNVFVFFQDDKNYENIVISILKKYFIFNTQHSDEKKLKKIIEFAKLDKDTPYFLIFKDRFPWEMLISLLFGVLNVFLFRENNEKKVKPLFLPENLIKQLSIENRLRDIINQEIINYQSSYYEEQRLMPTNLENKLINDLNIIFNVKENLNIKGIVNEIKFDIPEEKENELLQYFDTISNKLEIKSIEKNEIKNIFKTNLDELKKNILSRHFYNILLQRVGGHVKKKIEEDLSFTITSINK